MCVEKEEKTKELEEWMNSIELRSPLPSKEHSAEKSFSRLMARIRTDNKTVERFHYQINRYRIGLIAATIALLLTTGGWLYMVMEDNPQFMIAGNHTGMVQIVTLPDGSVIKLNNHSKLIYPESFSGDLREVFLEGEAYFDIAHNKKQPFIVRAGDLKIKVLGTKFSVNAASTNTLITATLLEGSIDIIDAKEHHLMKPNQQLTYNIASGKTLLTELSNAEREIRWTQNIWILSDTPLLDICKRLEQQFDVKFIIMNTQLTNKSFTGEFYVNESLDSILKIMQMTTSFNYTQRGKNIILE